MVALGFGKSAFGTDQNGPFVAGRSGGKCLSCAHQRLIREDQLPILGPVAQHIAQSAQLGDLGHIGAAALFGGLNRMGLQPILANAFGIGEFRLHRADAGGPHLSRFFDDEIGARLFDRCEKQPKIGRHLRGRGLVLTQKQAAALVRVDHLGAPFAIFAVEKRHLGPDRQPHHGKQILPLIPRQRHAFPRPQRVIYKETDFGAVSHGQETMSEPEETPEGQVADAVRGNWVDHAAPAWSRPYLRLSRADRPIGTWLLLLPCWWGVFLAAASGTGLRPFDAWIVIGCAIGAFLMRGAGCTWNDITDRDFDAAVARTKSRPIPSGQVTSKQAFAWLVIQAVLALGILLSFNLNTILLGLLSLVPVAIYPFAKRFTWWPQLFLGLAFNWGALLAWTAHSGSLAWPAVLLYLGGIAWTLFYDTIYAHQDKEDDALIGVKSTARLFGEDTKTWLKRFLLATVLFLGLAAMLALGPGGNFLALVLALVGIWGMGWHMVWQMLRLNIDDPALCMRLFRSNRDTGLIVAGFFAVAALV